MEIRKGTIGDLDAVTALEEICFPPAEAATREKLAERLSRYPAHFWLLLDGGELIAFVNGFCTDAPDLTDEMYANAALHDEHGAWQMIFGVNTHPYHRGRGYAARLIERAVADARADMRRGVVLTCKDALVHYYAKFAFLDEGVTEKSTHGGAVWHQMRLTF
jgi:GNAT superfamily N-acetyltransferase